MTRISTGIPIWKRFYNRYDQHSWTELQDIARHLGIPSSDKTKKGEIISLREFKTVQHNHEEKEEKEEKIAPDIEQYNPHTFPFDRGFNKTVVTFNNIPFNEDLIARLINYAIITTYIELYGNYSVHMTIAGSANTVPFDADGNPTSFREDRAVGGSNLLPLEFDGVKIKKSQVKKWMNENDTYFQNICLRSDL